MKLISRIRKTVSLTALTILFGTVSIVSLANGNEPIGEHSASSNTAEVKYIAAGEGAGLFNVIYNNTAGNRFSIVILDEGGNQLYQAYFTDRHFNRKFQLADPESTSKLTFVIRDCRDNAVQRFQVDATSRLVEDVEVKELQ